MYARCKLAGLLTARQIELLSALKRRKHSYGPHRFVRPVDVGGHRGSHHAKTLLSLHERGFALRRSASEAGKEHFLYAISEAGLDALHQLSLLSTVDALAVPGRKQDQNRADYLKNLLKSTPQSEHVSAAA